MSGVYIFHGDDLGASRTAFQETLRTHSGSRSYWFDGKRVTTEEVAKITTQQALFPQAVVLLFENLLSSPASKRLSGVCDLIATYDQTVLIWEAKKLTKTQLKKLSQAKEVQRNIHPIIFELMDSIGVSSGKRVHQLYRQALQINNSHRLHAMTTRQVRLLLQAKFDQPIAGPPFLKPKLRKQAKHWTVKDLLNWHRQLFRLEKGMKTGGLLLPFDEELDLLLTSK